MAHVRIDVELVGSLAAPSWSGEVYSSRGSRPIKATTLTECLEQVKAAAVALGVPMPPAAAPIVPASMPDPIDHERLAAVEKARRTIGMKSPTKPAAVVAPPRPAEPRLPRGANRRASSPRQQRPMHVVGAD